MPPAQRQPTSDQLRADVDRGRTGDKVDFPDPAAAPLGTDDEAAGRPPVGGAILRAREQERGRIKAPKPPQWPLWAIGIIALLALGFVVWMIS